MAMQAFPTSGTTLPSQQSEFDKQSSAETVHERRSGVAWWMWVLAGALFLLYTALSLRIHQRMLSNSYDLGIFEQVVQSYAHGHLPVAELKGPDFPVLGDHFSPILALVAPLYWLWPSPGTLLVTQAALIAVSVLPLTVWAKRTLGSLAAAVIGVCYGLSWGVATAVGFDFHEVAFAVPLLAFSLTALANNRPRAAAYWALPLLLVKEDLGLTVAVIGLVIALRGNRRLGIITASAGLAGTVLALLVILPAVNPTGSFAYWFYLDSPAGSAGGPADQLYKYTVGLITPQAKMSTLVLVLAPTLFLALRSPLLWIALPTLLWRGASGNAAHWGTQFHYSLVLMPIVFAAFIDALVRRRSSASSLRRYLVGCAAITVLLLPQFPLWQLVQPATWRTDPRIAVAHRLMDQIPDGATVQASSHLVPQLTRRTSVSLYGWPASRPLPEWIMVDTRVPAERRWPLSAGQEKFKLDGALRKGYRTVAYEDGFVLLKSPGGPGVPGSEPGVNGLPRNG
ncbi:DUF2079 domain-containing protein [Streptomyces sp. NBC_00879]|uniref:DUF2079 domain-containing protein n=1 Tax=unclassified Streptomyces TaxID=2593676 RepID=UPI00386CF582|nr:DUF2079 domain-containing protein [Streptomyces sp. NBC_00885]WSY75380.1 DUF2079 domain-containing protein [Streptomyces sp. NBC_00879]